MSPPALQHLIARMRGALAVALVAGLAVGGCVTNPATGKSQIMLVSEAQEVQMGREYDPQVVASIGLDPDSAWQRYVQQLGARLAAHGERPGLPWTFRVVDDPTINAFALPGGFIYVTRGILAHLNSEAELAAVLGHEIGHVTARHSVSQMSNQQLAGLGLAIGTIVSDDIGRFAGLANSALGILFLKHSRDDERQADDLGLRYLRRTTWDPREMLDVFQMLERVSVAQGGGRLPEWLATHPSPENRHEHIAQAIAAQPQDFSRTVVHRDPYLQRLGGQVFGHNPRDGYFIEGQFFHPDMRFRLAFPVGWATHNGKQAVVAVSPGKDAVVELALAKETSADAAARAFLAQQGITGGAMSRASLSGLPNVSAPFRAITDGGPLSGTVLFVEHRGLVFGLIGYAPETRWSTHQAAAERALRSFQVLTDPAALNVQPQRIQIVRLDRRTTIAALARARPSPASVATLALINQIDAQTSLEPGRLVKWVVGQPLPDAYTSARP